MNEFKPIAFDLWKTMDNDTWVKVWKTSYIYGIYHNVYHKVFDEIANVFDQLDELCE